MDKNLFEFKIAKQALVEWKTGTLPIDRVLNETLREHRVGSAQRGPISQAVYNMVRFGPALLGGDLNFENPTAMRGFEEALRSCFATDASRLLLLHERAKPTFESDAARHFMKVHGTPAFLSEEMVTVNAPAWHAFLHQMLVEAPLTVRVNTLKTTREKLLTRFEKMAAHAAHWAPDAIHFDSRWAMNLDEAFLAGEFEIQDEHSQLVSLAANPQPGERVLDLCAGGGGKTLHMATLMKNQGEVLAHDVVKSKLTDLMARARKAGLNNVRTMDTLPKRGDFDLVLIDAPCSGLGTLRRNPDRLQTLNETEIRRLAKVQHELVDRATSLIKAGGRIAYATCTVRPQENILVMNRLLEKGLKASDLAPSWHAHLGNKAGDFLTQASQSAAARVSSEGAFKMNPGSLQFGPSDSLSQTSGGLSGDGFFVALVK